MIVKMLQKSKQRWNIWNKIWGYITPGMEM